ncbi:VOC family protein [Noviherbaspirillum sp.]|uniref:VOC family protein n=1 Tax=Noviherbaspirillum sp. TaxID=1926288 RepID=UPI002FE04E48
MGYLRLRQICLAAPDLAPAERIFETVLGLSPCYRDPNVQRYGLENVLYPVGTDFIEIVVPTRPGTAAGRFLEQRGGRGGYMVILDCDDPQRRADRAEALGIRVANRLQYEDYTGMQLHPRDTGAAMIEFNHTHGGEAIDGPYHPAGPDWQRHVRNDTTRRMLSIDITAPDPASFASRWAQILERPLTSLPGQMPQIDLDGGAIRFVPADDAGQPFLSGITLQVADPQRMQSEAALAGCKAEGDGFWLCGVRIRPVNGTADATRAA